VEVVRIAENIFECPPGSTQIFAQGLVIGDITNSTGIKLLADAELSNFRATSLYSATKSTFFGNHTFTLPSPVTSLLVSCQYNNLTLPTY
jgi:hypothetical protein